MSFHRGRAGSRLTDGWDVDAAGVQIGTTSLATYLLDAYSPESQALAALAFYAFFTHVGPLSTHHFLLSPRHPHLARSYSHGTPGLGLRQPVVHRRVARESRYVSLCWHIHHSLSSQRNNTQPFLAVRASYRSS